MNKLKLILLLVLTINRTKVFALPVNDVIYGIQPRTSQRVINKTNFCRINIPVNVNDCDGVSCAEGPSASYLAFIIETQIAQEDHILERFLNLEMWKKKISRVSTTSRGLAIKELLRVNCIKTGTILPIPSSCQYGVDQYLGAGDTIDRIF